MCVREWKRIAEREANRYREHKAFIRGVEDAGGQVTDHYRISVQWVMAIEYVLAYLHSYNAEQERFFRLLFGIDGKQQYRGEKGMIALSFELNCSVPLLYHWKKEVLSLVLLAAAQTGALRPYAIEAHTGSERS